MWKTSTIVIILIIAILAIVYSQYDKNTKIQVFENQIETEVNKQVTTFKKSLEERLQKELKLSNQKVDDLSDSIMILKERIEIISHGGEKESIRAVLKETGEKKNKKYKIKKGEFFKHPSSQITLYVKRDFYEDAFEANITLPNRDTETLHMDVGKYYYYWDYSIRELTEILVTFVGKNHVEVDWSYYKTTD